MGDYFKGVIITPKIIGMCIAFQNKWAHSVDVTARQDDDNTLNEGFDFKKRWISPRPKNDNTLRSLSTIQKWIQKSRIITTDCEQNDHERTIVYKIGEIPIR